MGVDYDRDGRASPFGKPDDAFAGTARYLVERGNYRRGEAWGCEVKVPAGQTRLANNRTMRPYAKWHELGVRRADGTAFARPGDQAKLWMPVAGGPAFLVGQNFQAVYSYNPSTQLCAGALPSRRPDPRRSAVPPAVPRRRARADPGGGQGNTAPA